MRAGDGEKPGKILAATHRIPLAPSARRGRHKKANVRTWMVDSTQLDRKPWSDSESLCCRGWLWFRTAAMWTQCIMHTHTHTHTSKRLYRVR